MKEEKTLGTCPFASKKVVTAMKSYNKKKTEKIISGKSTKGYARKKLTQKSK